MNKTIFLRPLTITDSNISYQWRNDPAIWKFTPFKPSSVITPEIETKWLADALEREDQKRFAICLKKTGRYIGNVQLIKIQNGEAEFHLFIGETDCWGKGLGELALILMLNYAFVELQLKNVMLQVHKDNVPAIKIYKRQGFKVVGYKDDYLEMVLNKNENECI